MAITSECKPLYSKYNSPAICTPDEDKMKLSCIKTPVFYLFYSLLILLLFLKPASAQTNTATGISPPEYHKLNANQAVNQQFSQRELWEHIVSFPGGLLFVPIKIFFYGVTETIRFSDESNLFKKLNDLLTADDGSWAIMPSYSSRTGGGLDYFHFVSDTLTRFTFSVSAGLRGRQGYRLGYEGITLFDGRAAAEFEVRYRLYSDERFYGIGPDSNFDNETNYAHEQVSVSASVSSKLDENIVFIGEAVVERNNILGGRNSATPSTTTIYRDTGLPGMVTGSKFTRLNLEIIHDYRNNTGRTTNGGISRVRLGIVNEIDGDKFGFWQISLDARKYFHLFYNRVLAVRAHGTFTEPLLDRSIPFYYLSDLGHQETIRGFRRGRFRDRDMAFASVEYRFPVAPVLDSFIFLDAGHVAKNLVKDFSTADLQYGYGWGVNIFSENRLAAQFVIGKSTDGFRVYFNFNEVF